MESTEANPHSRIMLRPIASPLPMGFLGLSFGTFLFAAFQLGWLPEPEEDRVALAVLLLTVPLELLASVFGFLCRDPGAAVVMAVLAGSWALVGTFKALSPPGTYSEVLGVALLAVAVLLLVTSAAEIGKPLVGAVVVLAAVRFAVTGITELTASSGWQTAAGLTGLLLAVLAAYAALAFLLENAQNRPVLPVLRGKPVGEEEPGVRPRL
ncbi:GPR1/FUN34/YaaH family transporter [Streptomyces sp. TRM 70361]|uniref:GPR1/FUN34/YaaH family transporter n=1 Tax=Streptomyces sp. TRM 70361 TaxID=3116553 RepID=UPI002E7BCAB0|nr:GPR1/FUN34/YaaH family transporter [Streptomyces sp. TRM 70361]MEE1941089.1 GPR1/FUN34/YaaH family transporter [Streptomyces sp. TRM 70361]